MAAGQSSVHPENARTVEILEGSYPLPAGLLQVKQGLHGPIVQFIPTGPIPINVTALQWYWTGTGFDGSAVGFGDGISEPEAQLLPPAYRYEEP